MAIFSRHLSYTEKVLSARKRRKTFGRILLIILAVSFVRAFFVQSYSVDSSSMQPALMRGDRILSFPLPVGAVTIFGKLPPLSDIKRGELVIVAPDPIPTESQLFRAWDSLARFFTFQKFSPQALRYGASSSSLEVYRVIGLPGDTIGKLPGQGNAISGERILHGNQFFVASDDKSVLAGSPLWGPIGVERIVGRVVVIFWPPRRMRIP